MEVSNKIKATLFAQYMGRPIQYIPPEGQRVKKYSLFRFTDWGINIFYAEMYWLVSGMAKFPLKDRFLVLKSISAITDEDAIEFCKILYPYAWYTHTADKAKYCIDKLFNSDEDHTVYNFQRIIDGIQFLQSKGYDLPHYLLQGKTLKEAGIAIYEQ